MPDCPETQLREDLVTVDDHFGWVVECAVSDGSAEAEARYREAWAAGTRVMSLAGDGIADPTLEVDIFRVLGHFDEAIEACERGTRNPEGDDYREDRTRFLRLAGLARSRA